MMRYSGLLALVIFFAGALLPARAAEREQAPQSVSVEVRAIRLERGKPAKMDSKLRSIARRLRRVFGRLGYTRFTQIASTTKKNVRVTKKGFSWAIPEDLFVTVTVRSIVSDDEGVRVTLRVALEKDGDEIGSTTQTLRPQEDEMGYMVAGGKEVLERGDLGIVYQVRLEQKNGAKNRDRRD